MLKRTTIVCVAILLSVVTSSSFAQGKFGLIGKFLKSGEADILFGKPIQSIQINANELQEAVKGADNYIMFGLKNNQLNITNERRKKLTANSHDTDEKEVMFFFSKKIIDALVSFAGEFQIFAEQRPNNINTFTIKSKGRSTNSNMMSNEIKKSGAVMNTTTVMASDITLEFSCICPPICFE